MGTVTERLALLISADAKGAVRELNAVGTAAEKNLTKAKSRTDQWAAGLTKGGAAAVGFAAVAGAGLFKFAKASETAHAQTVKLEATLASQPKLAGASAKSFIDLANALQKKTAADNDAIVGAEALLGQFNLTEKQVLHLTPLVVDLSAKLGIGLDQAAKAVGKSVNGTTGGLARMGVLVDKNKAKTDAYAATTEALSRAVGGFATRQGATFSGRLERLKNELQDVEEGIGTGVVSAISDLVSPLEKVTTGFGAFGEAGQAAVGKVATFATLGIGVAGGLSLIVGQTLKARDNFAALAQAAPKLVTALKAIGTAGAIVGGLVVLDSVANIWRGKGQDVDAFTAAIKRYGAEGRGASVITKEFGGSLEDLGKGIKLVGDSSLADNVDRVADRISTLLPGSSGAQNRQRLAGDIKNLDKALADLVRSGDADAATEGFKRLSLVAKEQGVGQDVVNRAFNDYKDALKEAAAAGDVEAQAALGQVSAQGQLHAAVDKVNQDYKTQVDNLLAATGAGVDYQQQVLSTKDAITQATAAEKKGGDEAKKALLDAEQAALSQGTAAVNAMEKQAGKTLSAAQKAAVLKGEYQKLAGTLAPGSPLRVFLDQLIAQLDNAARERVAKIRIEQINAVGSVSTGGARQARAAGGPVMAGEVYLVGEKGPELFVSKKAGSILPTGSFNAAAEGAGDWRSIRDALRAQVGGAINAAGGPNEAEINRLIRALGRKMVNELADEIAQQHTLSPIAQAIQDREDAIAARRERKQQNRQDRLSRAISGIGTINDFAQGTADFNDARTARARGGSATDFRSALLERVQQQQSFEQAISGLTRGGLKDLEALGGRAGLSRQEIAQLEQLVPKNLRGGGGRPGPRDKAQPYVVVNVHGSVTTERELVKSISDAIVRNKRKGFNGVDSN